MDAIIRIHAPLNSATVSLLRAGDNVLITGELLVARDAAHKRLVDLLDKGESLPVELKGAIIYYMGPSPARPGKVIGAAGPTTAGRMDKYAPRLMDAGIKGMVGKGQRSESVVDSMKKNGCVYFAAIGGAGALISKTITSYRVIAFDELGPEALSLISVQDFPAIVVIDSEGNNFYTK